MRRFLLWMGIVALVLQVSAGTAQAAERPFKVTASAPIQMDTFFPGTVVGTEIGQGSFTITPVAGTEGSPWGGYVWCGTASFILTITASTGDTISAEVLGLACQDAIGGPPFSGRGSGLYRIISGTGRFMNATGSGFFTMIFEVPTPPTLGTMTLSFEGTISY